jgi:hypothetical protein
MSDEIIKDISTEDNASNVLVEPAPVTTGDVSPDMLPKNTVHCYPANPMQVLRRRIVSLLVIILCVAGIVFFLQPDTLSYAFVALISIVLISCALVFLQTFLIAGYRIAIDYNSNEVVLRYMFRKLKIPFAEFDSREGEPDKAQKMMNQANIGGNKPQKMYLILDNVNDSACYQTSSYDLASTSDFLKLKDETSLISKIYGAQEKLTAEKKAFDDEDNVNKIVSDAMAEMSDPFGDEDSTKPMDPENKE